MDSIGEALREFMARGPGKAVQDKMNQLMNHELVQELKSKHSKLTDSTIRANLNRINECITDRSNCEKCINVEGCPNLLQGHFTELDVDEQGNINERKTPCPFWKQRTIQLNIEKRIRTFHVDKTVLSNGYNIEEMLRLDTARSKSVFQIVEYIARTKKEGRQLKGLYLSGDLGTGKTYLMGYLVNELAKQGLTGIMVYLPDFCEDLKSLFQEPAKLSETVNLLKNTDLLVLDDLGAENINPWFRDHVLGAILNHRMNRLPTFYTSNFDLDDLEDHLCFTNKEGYDENKGKRIMERIRHYTDQIRVNGFNKRYSK
jgi:primosomal protein DnaI